MRILHIGPDSQFLQFIARIFETVSSGANDYVVLSKNGLDLRFPISQEHGTVRVLPDNYLSALRVPRYVRGYDIIIAHSFTLHAALAFLAARGTKNVWSGWGFDYYDGIHGLPGKFYGSETTKLAQSLRASDKTPYSIIRRQVRAFRWRLKNHAVKKVGYFSAPIPDDFDVLKERYARFSGKYTQLNYGSVENTFDIGASAVHGSNILLGNSATLSNNHVEAFEILAKCDLKGRKVIAPLGYGDAIYRERVVELGERFLGNAFIPLTAFLPLDKYDELISSCNEVIMNHKRQQALGNIGAVLYKGGRVYFDESSPVFRFLKARGAVVFLLEDYPKLSSRRPLPTHQRAINRQVLCDFWGAAAVEGNARRLIDMLARAPD